MKKAECRVREKVIKKIVSNRLIYKRKIKIYNNNDLNYHSLSIIVTV